MHLETVDSEVIHAVGYDPDISVLEIIFTDGRIYQYRGVPREVFEGLMRAESKGHYFQENIRGEFDYWQWGREEAQEVRAEQKGTASKQKADSSRQPE